MATKATKKTTKRKTVTGKMATKKAPYGTRKDGTPKKKPGPRAKV